jgi:hypothetical protein
MSGGAKERAARSRATEPAVVTRALNPTDWALVWRALDGAAVAHGEEAEFFAELAEAHGEDWSEEIEAQRQQQTRCHKLMELLEPP